jgi:hypothetical protein
LTVHRALATLIVLLAACLGGLWAAGRALEAGRERERAADSAFHRIHGTDTPPPASVGRIDLTIPGAGEEWSYVKEADGWRMPRYRQGFAKGRALEGLAGAFLEGRGTIVGRMPGDAERFGIVRGKALEAKLRDSSGNLLVHALAGRVPPGQRSSECFVAAEGRDPILHLDSNPWVHVEWSRGDRFPPLLDPKVIPEALGRGLPARIELGGSSPPAIQALIRREAPRDPRMPMDRGPRYEWFGAFAEGERRLNDQAAFAYLSAISGLGFEELLGPQAEGAGPFVSPELTVMLEYDGGAKDTLILGGAAPGGARHLLHSTTRQGFLIAAAGARGLSPDVKALLESPPAPPAPPPGAAPQPQIPPLPVPPR